MMIQDASDVEAMLARTEEHVRRARLARANLRRTLDRHRREFG